MACVQVCCYKDSKLLKLFQDIVRILYDNDVIAEDTIMWCARKRTLHALCFMALLRVASPLSFSYGLYWPAQPGTSATRYLASPCRCSVHSMEGNRRGGTGEGNMKVYCA